MKKSVRFSLIFMALLMLLSNFAIFAKTYQSYIYSLGGYPMASPDGYTIEKTLAEPLKLHTNLSDAEINDMILDLMGKVGLQPFHAKKFPHEFSGGQRQRIGIARALYKQAAVLLMDEATSALDNRTEWEINNTLLQLKTNYKDLTILSIAHRDSSLEYCDRIITIENKYE